MKQKIKEVTEFMDSLKKHWGDKFKHKLNVITNKHDDLSNRNNPGVNNMYYLYQWHDAVMESGEDICYLNGDKQATVEDLKKRALDFIKKRFWDSHNKRKDECMNPESEYYELDLTIEEFEENETQDHNDSGYCGVDEVRDIESFWEKLDEKNWLSKFLNIEWYEDNLDGDRWYFFSNANLTPILFNLFIKKLGDKSYEDFVEEAEYSEILEVEEDLFGMKHYSLGESVYIPTLEESDNLYAECDSKRYDEERRRFNNMLESFKSLSKDYTDINEKVKAIQKLKFK